MICQIAIATCCWLSAPVDAGGVIEGVVVNGSRGMAPVPEAVVVLRAEHQGAMMPIAQTTVDAQGRFRFEKPPLPHDVICLPGANYQGIHYPGRRVRADGRLSLTDQKIVVYEPVAEPSPLLAARHEIEIRPEVGVLVVTETILVANGSLRSYVGVESETDQPTATLRLSIPSQFEKVTFAKEFFGRQFRLNDERLESHIPWTPGERELKFTYRLPLEHRNWLFRRPLDLPTKQMRIRVFDKHKDVTCNLAASPTHQEDAILFESQGSLLPAGHAIEVQLGSLPVPWTAVARRWAVGGLVLLISATSAFMLLRRRAPATPAIVRPTNVKARKPRRAA